MGLFAEDVREDSALSPLIGRMVGVDAFSQVLTNPLLSINVFKPETFSDVGWQIIQQTRTLEDVLKRNMNGERSRRATLDLRRMAMSRTSRSISAGTRSVRTGAAAASAEGLESVAHARRIRRGRTLPRSRSACRMRRLETTPSRISR